MNHLSGGHVSSKNPRLSAFTCLPAGRSVSHRRKIGDNINSKFMNHDENNNQTPFQNSHENEIEKKEVEVLDSKPLVSQEKRRTVNIGTFNFYNNLPFSFSKDIRTKHIIFGGIWFLSLL